MTQKFHTLGRFEYVADALVIKGRLEAEGIPVFLRDANTINSDPMISHAIGGVKLQVFSTDRERAQEIYDAIRAYATDDEGNPIVCPNCKAKRSEVHFIQKGILAKLFPFFQRTAYKCLNCGIITTRK